MYLIYLIKTHKFLYINLHLFIKIYKAKLTHGQAQMFKNISLKYVNLVQIT